MLITIKRVHEKESKLFDRLCEIYQKQRDSYKNSRGSAGINYRSSDGSGKVRLSGQKLGALFEIKENNETMKSFRSRERSNSWDSRDLLEKSNRRDNRPGSDNFGSAFMNMTKKSGFIQAIGNILGEDKNEVSEIMQN